MASDASCCWARARFLAGNPGGPRLGRRCLVALGRLAGPVAAASTQRAGDSGGVPRRRATRVARAIRILCRGGGYNVVICCISLALERRLQH